MSTLSWSMDTAANYEQHTWGDSGGGSEGGRIKKKLNGSFAPSSSTLCTSSTGCSCCPVHFTYNWQEGTRRPGTNRSTWRFVIYWKKMIHSANKELQWTFFTNWNQQNWPCSWCMICQLSYWHTHALSINRLAPGYVCGVIVHPLSSTTPSFGISRVILSLSNITSWSGPILALVSAYLASTACNNGNELHD